jgi:hypothetical protein
MALTRSFKHTIVARVQRDPAFARGLLDEAATLFLNGEPDTARFCPVHPCYQASSPQRGDRCRCQPPLAAHPLEKCQTPR